jgi:hypothetical protein
MLQEGDYEKSPEPFRKLPDPAICRAQVDKQTGAVQCLVTYPECCQYNLRHGNKIFCLNPEFKKIIARTESK